MGVSARPIGKTKGIFVRTDNEIVKEREKKLKETKEKGKRHE